MKKIRTTLGIFGGMGLFVWPALGFVLWCVRDWKPGGAQGGLSQFQGWFCELSLVAVSAYYLAVATFPWSRRLFAMGGVLHATLLISVVTLLSFTDGVFHIVPVIFVGPTVWFVYAMRMREAKPEA